MIQRIGRHLARFARDDRGNITVEAIIMLPVLLWLFGAIWVWFDVSRQQSLNQKVNYTIGDMISRETEPLDHTYIDNAYRLAMAMLNQTPEETDLRITAIGFQSKGKGVGSAPILEVAWSHARGEKPIWSGDISALAQDIPLMARGDQLILVETWSDHDPIFEAGLAPFQIAVHSFTRPRFTPQVLFDINSDKQNNGWGNGDQDAPGNSLCNNNAENYDEALAAVECLVDNLDGAVNTGGV
ncbi:TadE/TadG family type IV pilus assembly protein [Roseivivax sp. CAU 1761]